jgi:hypothetical protein
MKPLKVFCLVLFCVIQTAFLAYSQTDIGNAGVQEDVISDTPTADEISNLFLLATKGEKDPFKVVALVASKKDKAIPALKEFLSQPVDTAKDKASAAVIQPNKQYAIYTLDAIGTHKAKELLKTVALTHPDLEVRGLAIKTLACNFYYRTKNDEETGNSKGLKPDKEIVHILLKNADDTTYVERFNETIGKMAREGINNWTGEDYGEVFTGSQRKVEENRIGMNFKESRENWWQKNNSKINWNKSTKKFEEK